MWEMWDLSKYVEKNLNSLSNMQYASIKFIATNLENEGIPKNEAWVITLRKNIIEEITDHFRSQGYFEEQINSTISIIFKCINGYYSYNSPEYNYHRNIIENAKNFVISAMTRRLKEDGYSNTDIHDLTSYYLKEVFSDINTDTYSYTHSTDFDWANVIVPEPVNNQQPKSFLFLYLKTLK